MAARAGHCASVPLRWGPRDRELHRHPPAAIATAIARGAPGGAVRPARDGPLLLPGRRPRRDANGGFQSWDAGARRFLCLDTVEECAQRCEATPECGCFAYATPASLPATFDREGCVTAGSGRCSLWIGSAVATQGSGQEGYRAYRVAPAPRPPPSAPSPPRSPPRPPLQPPAPPSPPSPPSPPMAPPPPTPPPAQPTAVADARFGCGYPGPHRAEPDSTDALERAVDDSVVTCIRLAPVVYALLSKLFVRDGRMLAIVADDGQATLDGGGSIGPILTFLRGADVVLANLRLRNGNCTGALRGVVPSMVG